MRRTTITRSRFTTFITNWWANKRLSPGALILALLVLLSCDDDQALVGLKNPNRDFQVFAKEFTIPTKVFQVDSLPTSYGYVISPANGVLTMGERRFFTGTINDPHFGKTTAKAITQFYPTNYPTTNAAAVFQKLTLTLIFDYYWAGAETSSEQQFQVYEVNDSILSYLPHFSNSSTPYGKLLGEATHTVSPTDFDQNILDNSDADPTNNLMDSINVTLDQNLGRALLAAAMDTVGTHEREYTYFSKFRRHFKGFAIVSPNSDKIVGFDPAHAKARILLDYKIDTTKYQLEYRFALPGQTVGAAEYICYTEVQTDRSGTPLAALPAKYQEFEPNDGMRYLQAGTGVVTKLDFSEVFDHFKNIPTKAFSVAELRIEADNEQKHAPSKLLLRALRPNNRNISASTVYYDGANDAFNDVDVTFVGKHLMNKYNEYWDKPYFRVDVGGDAGTLFTMSKSTSGNTVYTGYLTNFLQTELGNTETDFLRYYALIPQTPDITRGVNGFYFPADKIKLKIYYTTPNTKE